MGSSCAGLAARRWMSDMRCEGWMGAALQRCGKQLQA